MGIYSRDYVREDSPPPSAWSGEKPAWMWLIIITVVVFVLQMATVHRPMMDGKSYIGDWFALQADKVLTGQVWRLVTYAFLEDYGDLMGLLFNMLGLWWFGAEMERLYGSREFVAFYLVAAFLSGVGFLVWLLAMGFDGPMMGPTSTVLAVMTLYATHYPRQKIYFMGIIPVEIRWLIVIYLAYDLWPVVRALNGELPFQHVSNAAHAIGIVFGWLYRRSGWHLSEWFDFSFLHSWRRRLRRNQAQKSFRVYDPEPEADLEGELDRILAKIHDQGSASLTEREQAILTRASQQYKNRQ